VIFELLWIGLAIALNPIPLTTFIIVLSSRRGVLKGACFVFGWLVSLVIVIGLTVTFTQNNPPKPNTQPSLAAIAVKIAIGAGLLLIAARRRRAMGRPKKPKNPPKWQASVDEMSPLFALGLGPLVQPWGLIGAGAATIMEAKLSTVGSYLVLALFAFVATSTYLLMEIYAALRPSQANALLAQVRAWIDSHTDQLIVIVATAVGLLLIIQNVYLVAQ
jgi:Sap, sulfolipid-1-addressing protein